uniref:OCIA domain-containing protein 1 n=1 Tax=Pelusios castaneus TaxID=367368 RepID=A0A8C8SIT9_9SAUR
MDTPGQSERRRLGYRDPNSRELFNIPTEEEKRVLYECMQESFWYRALPLSLASMAVTYGLIKKGFLTSSSTRNSFPKIGFAGVIGFVAGRISYMSACNEKFRKLENSPIGRSLQGLPFEPYAAQKSESANLPFQSSFGSSPMPEAPLSSSYSDEYSSTGSSFSNDEPVPFSTSLSESSPTGITEHNTSEPVPVLEKSPKRKSVTYEELRNRNRETYEVLSTQKAETPVKSSQERAFKTKAKLNKYGDVWEE